MEVNDRVSCFLALAFVRGKVDTWLWYMKVNGRVSYFLALGFVRGNVDSWSWCGNGLACDSFDVLVNVSGSVILDNWLCTCINVSQH